MSLHVLRRPAILETARAPHGRGTRLTLELDEVGHRRKIPYHFRAVGGMTAAAHGAVDDSAFEFDGLAAFKDGRGDPLLRYGQYRARLVPHRATPRAAR